VCEFPKAAVIDYHKFSALKMETGRMAQVAKCLLCEHETPVPQKKKKKQANVHTPQFKTKLSNEFINPVA
jgi:hypothetical protein